MLYLLQYNFAGISISKLRNNSKKSIIIMKFCNLMEIIIEWKIDTHSVIINTNNIISHSSYSAGLHHMFLYWSANTCTQLVIVQQPASSDEGRTIIYHNSSASKDYWNHKRGHTLW